MQRQACAVLAEGRSWLRSPAGQGLGIALLVGLLMVGVVVLTSEPEGSAKAPAATTASRLRALAQFILKEVDAALEAGGRPRGEQGEVAGPGTCTFLDTQPPRPHSLVMLHALALRGLRALVPVFVVLAVHASCGGDEPSDTPPTVAVTGGAGASGGVGSGSGGADAAGDFAPVL